MPAYRVFVRRTYIAVHYFDIEAETPKNAEKVAVAAIKSLAPDVRAEATDNGWMVIRDNDLPGALEIDYLGYGAGTTAENKPEMTEVFRDKRGRGVAYETASGYDYHTRRTGRWEYM